MQAIGIVPLALLLIFATVQFGVACYTKAALTAAAEDGLRATQTNPAVAPGPEAERSARTNAGYVTDLTIASTRDTHGQIRVTVAGRIPAAFPGLQWTIHGTATGPVERFRPQGQ